MPIQPVTVDLNKGLDLSSGVLFTSPGSIIDCLNYEYTNAFGLRRIDGYELYDGWANGGVTDLWTINLSVIDAGLYGAVSRGECIRLNTDQGWITVGTVVEPGETSLVYSPVNKDQAIIRSGDFLAFGTSTTNTIQTTADALPLYSGRDVDDYLSLLRGYQWNMRDEVTTSVTPIAGLHVYKNNVLVAKDAPKITINGIGSSVILVGDFVAIGALEGLVIAKSHPDYWIEPYSHGVVSTAIQVKNKNGTNRATATASSVVRDDGPSDYAYLTYLLTPDTDFVRGDGLLFRSTILTFDNGTQAAGQDPQVGQFINVGPGFPANYYLGYIKSIVLTGGSWAAGTAAGRMEVVFLDPRSATSGAGAHNTVAVGDTVRIDGNSIFVVDAITRTSLAGTKKLKYYDSRYVAETYNFGGRDDTFEAYGANGAARAFWAKLVNERTNTYKENPPLVLGYEANRSYGNIIVNTSASIDRPKWVSMHSRSCLALGYAGGEVTLSVADEPYNFNGLDGAQVLTTGDEVTGLVEAVGDTTVVFGRRSISRITGLADSLAMSTISPRSGAFPYTCTVVGRSPVFTDYSGISTLEQSDTYSDFLGERSSAPVDSALRPRLVASFQGNEAGGVHCAFSVRNKNQYRLFLRSGKVFVMCMTSGGPKFTISELTNDGTARLPFAWSSQIMDSGKEMIVAAWDGFYSRYAPTEPGNDLSYTAINPKEIYELDSGWGFNGYVFDHYFVTSYMFMESSSNDTQIPKFRLFGKSHGAASLQVSTSAVETDFDQAFSSAREASIPNTYPASWYPTPKDVTCFGYLANWGLGIKIKIENKNAKGSNVTEPSHICHTLVLYMDNTGAQDG